MSKSYLDINDDEDRWAGSAKGNITNGIAKSKESLKIANTIRNDISTMNESNSNMMNLTDTPKEKGHMCVNAKPAPEITFKNVHDQILKNNQNFKTIHPEISCDNIANLVKSLVKVDMPEIKFLLLLDFAKFSQSKLVSYLAVGHQLLYENLYEILSDPAARSVYTDWQIELRRVSKDSSICQLFLRLDAHKWHDLQYANGVNHQSEAKAYINRVKNEHDWSGASNPRSSEGSNANPVPKNIPCYRPVVCDRVNQCGFFVCGTHRIYMEEEAWYAAVRCKKAPIITINPKQHYTNKEWVVTINAWEIFFQVVRQLQNDLSLKTLPFERAYSSDGGWLSSPNSNHGHINMVLSPEVIELSKNGPKHLRILQNSTQYPVDYRLDHANQLEEIINNENTSNQVADVWDELTEDLSSLDVDDSSSKLLLNLDKYAASGEIYTKRTTIGRHLSNKVHGKINKISYNELN